MKLKVKIDVVVTSQKNLVKYLKQKKIIDKDVKIIQQVKPKDILNKNVLGILPHSLSCLTKSFTEIFLIIPKEKRRKELTLKEIEEYILNPATYSISCIGYNSLF